MIEAQQALLVYFRQLKKNTTQGSRVDNGTDELGLAFLIDDDLADDPRRARPGAGPPVRLLPGTAYYIDQHPELLPSLQAA